MRKREEKLGLVVEESVNGGKSCFGKCRRKRNTAAHIPLFVIVQFHCFIIYWFLFVRPHMRGHEQHPQTRSGSPHNACISLVNIDYLIAEKWSGQNRTSRTGSAAPALHPVAGLVCATGSPSSLRSSTRQYLRQFYFSLLSVLLMTRRNYYRPYAHAFTMRQGEQQRRGRSF